MKSKEYILLNNDIVKQILDHNDKFTYTDIDYALSHFKLHIEKELDTIFITVFKKDRDSSFFYYKVNDMIGRKYKSTQFDEYATARCLQYLKFRSYKGEMAIRKEKGIGFVVFPKDTI